MDDIENGDPNTSGNNIYGLQTNFIDVEDDEGEDEYDYKTTYLQEHMNIDKYTLDGIVENNKVNGDF